MRHAIYENPVTHQFTLVRLPVRFIEGDKLPIEPTARWFATHEDAVAALPELLNEDE
jgi:hypothetical protein